LVISGVAAQDAVTQPVLRRSEEQVSTWLEQHRDRPPIVRAFVQRMPKGGDIHTHLSGAVYAERYLSWAAADGYCVDAVAIKLVLPQDCGKTPNAFPAAELFKRSGVYAALIDRWSLRYSAFAGKSGHDQFFQAFDGFDLISSSPSRKGDMVADVANRAASQHVSYLELLLTTQGGATQQLARSIGWDPTNFAEQRRQLLAKGLPSLVDNGKQELDRIERQTATAMGCGTAKAQPGCRVTIRFLHQAKQVRHSELIIN